MVPAYLKHVRGLVKGGGEVLNIFLSRFGVSQASQNFLIALSSLETFQISREFPNLVVSNLVVCKFCKETLFCTILRSFPLFSALAFVWEWRMGGGFWEGGFQIVECAAFSSRGNLLLQGNSYLKSTLRLLVRCQV